MNKNIVIVHYNTPLLTECLVKSINLFVEDAKIYIFDNSDKLPFTAEFDNVTIIDNTKGQIINFDEWLKKYPDRVRSSAFRNNYGSAKHCYSIDKCMDLVNDNFVLLDSDILLKKDISQLFDNESIFVGDTEIWKAKTPMIDSHPKAKTRAIPYICFINTKMCKKHNIRYFNDKCMYGLSSNGDSYDTGSYFFEQITKKNLKWKKITYKEYIVHYKAGTWVDSAKKYDNYKPIPIERWLEINKRVWYSSDGIEIKMTEVKNNHKTENNKKVIYTCITGGYDSLIEPSYITDGFDYICFTDNMGLKSNIWDIRPLPKETEGLSQVKKQRYVKINAHKVVGEYDLSIWVDGNVEIRGDLNVFLKKTLTDDCSVYVPTHPSRKCIYAEARAVVSMRKDINVIVNKQMDRYKKEGFPKNYGLLQSNIMLRKHNNADCIRLMEKWFSELKEESHRDQLSFNYASWKNEDVKVKYMEKMIYRSAWFNWKGKHKKNNRINPSIKQNKVNTNNLNKTTISTNRTSYYQKYVFKQSLNRKIPTHKLVIYG